MFLIDMRWSRGGGVWGEQSGYVVASRGLVLSISLCRKPCLYVCVCFVSVRLRMIVYMSSVKTVYACRQQRSAVIAGAG